MCFLAAFAFNRMTAGDISILRDLSLLRFEPQFLRPLPPVCPRVSSDVFWIQERLPTPPLLWDHSVNKLSRELESSRRKNVEASKSSGNPVLKELLDKAIKQSLNSGEQKLFSTNLEKNPTDVNHMGMSPSKVLLFFFVRSAGDCQWSFVTVPSQPNDSHFHPNYQSLPVTFSCQCSSKRIPT